MLPVVDLNGDGIVDLKDFSKLAQYWGQDEPSCDVGPMPWGDGRVDIHDMAALGTYWLTYPGAVAHWRLDETEGSIAHDSIGDKDGALHGEPIWQPAGGKLQGTLHLDGVDDYVSTPFVLNPADWPFSVFAWIKGEMPGQVIISQIGSANWLAAGPSEGWLITDLKGGGAVGPPIMVPGCDYRWRLASSRTKLGRV